MLIFKEVKVTILDASLAGRADPIVAQIDVLNIKFMYVSFNNDIFKSI